MELLEFRDKMLQLCNVEQVSQLSGFLMDKVLCNDYNFYDKYMEIIDDTKDWLQALWQYYEADRTQKKQDYTPKSLCNLVSRLAGDDIESIYDCCGGSGALTLSIVNNIKDVEIDIEELDSNVIPFLLFNLATHNADGYVNRCNVLTGETYRTYHLTQGEKYSNCGELKNAERKTSKRTVAISNPPYNISWQPPTELEALAEGIYPVIPPKSNANYAFVFQCLNKSDRAIIVLPNGIYSQSNEYDIRKYLVDNDLIEATILLPQNMFEATSISTCILLLNKNKTKKGKISFIDSRTNCVIEEREQNGQFGGKSHTNRTYKKQYNVLSEANINKVLVALENEENEAGFSKTVSNEDVIKQEYILTPSRYVEFKAEEETHRPFQEIADNINYIVTMQNSCKLVINETIAKNLGFDLDVYKKSKENSKQQIEEMKKIGIDLIAEDFIQFTKNKNEFMFKCNDKNFLPDMLMQFLSVWKNQIALLNTMQNQYLAELRDALIPELMRGNLIIDAVSGE